MGLDRILGLWPPGPLGAYNASPGPQSRARPHCPAQPWGLAFPRRHPERPPDGSAFISTWSVMSPGPPLPTSKEPQEY